MHGQNARPRRVRRQSEDSACRRAAGSGRIRSRQTNRTSAIRIVGSSPLGNGQTAPRGAGFTEERPAARASARPRLVLPSGAWPCLQWNNHRRRVPSCPKAATAT
jgi:hypothetical protein